MSIYLKGDGQVYSSIKFNTITLPNPFVTPHILESNVEVVRTDAGCLATYEKGTYRKIFPYQWTLLTEDQKLELWTWWQKIRGQAHWFLLQPADQILTEVFEQNFLKTSKGNVRIYNDDLGSGFNKYDGLWAFILDGNCRKEARKILGWALQVLMEGCYVEVLSPYSEDVIVGTKVIIGYPVLLDSARFEATPRYPNFWDAELTFKEKIIDVV